MKERVDSWHLHTSCPWFIHWLSVMWCICKDLFIPGLPFLITYNSCLFSLESRTTAQQAESDTGPFVVLGLIFVASLVAMAFVYWSFPNLKP